MHHVVIIVNIVMLTLCFHNVTCYTDPLLSYIYVNITNLLNITCTLVVKKRNIREVIVYYN